jgi:hypothetical protein
MRKPQSHVSHPPAQIPTCQIKSLSFKNGSIMDTQGVWGDKMGKFEKSPMLTRTDKVSTYVYYEIALLLC